MAIPPTLMDASPILQAVNETGVIPVELSTAIQNLIGALYAAVGGFVGLFIISALVRWWQGQKTKERFDEINQRLTRLERKIDEMMKRKR